VEAEEQNESENQPNRVREIRENRLMTQAQLARKARCNCLITVLKRA
jgi:DNA-binding XRE family transcriptional regulator